MGVEIEVNADSVGVGAGAELGNKSLVMTTTISKITFFVKLGINISVVSDTILTNI